VLKEGDKAPDLTLDDDAGGKVSLSSLWSADKTLVLYFYPKDDTPGCTREACAFSTPGARAKLEKAGAVVVGVSRDKVATHAKFKGKYKLKVPLLADPERAAHEAYGAWGEKTMYGKKVLGAIRCTFVIRGGKILKVFPSVKVDGHVDQVLATLGSGTEAAPAKTKTTAKAAAAAPKTKKAAPKAKKTTHGSPRRGKTRRS
jgi:thioredoxin-dependent peroxiredoxin